MKEAIFSLDFVRWRLSKMYSKFPVPFRLVYGGNDLKSDFPMTNLSEIKNVSRIDSLPHCAKAIDTSKLKFLTFTWILYQCVG